METTEISLKLNFGRRQLIAALALLLMAWHPGFLGSETLTLTTYYPAPYGGYVSLLTTNQTLLARDGGNVGIRTTTGWAPRRPLDVNGEIVTTSRLTMAQDMTSNSLTWSTDNSGGRYRIFEQPNINVGGTEHLTILSGSGNVGINTSGPAEKLHVLGNARVDNGNLMLNNGSITINGNGWSSGFITGVCWRVSYDVNAGGVCPAGAYVMGYVGDGVARVWGFLPLNQTSNGNGRYVVMG